MSEVNYLFLVEKLKIDEHKIEDDLSQYYKQVRNRYMQRSKIEKMWGSVENYVNVLYWMKFVMKLSHYEMDELTKVRDFYKAYKDLGWNYDTFDFQECQDKHILEVTRLKKIYEEYNPNADIFKSPDYINKRKSIYLPPTSMTRVVNNYNVSDIEELVQKMYYLVYVAMLNTSEIAVIFGKDRVTVGKLLRRINMNISRKEARKRIERSGRGNHTQSMVAGKKAILSRSIKNGVTANNSENICRAQIETRLYSYLNVKEYEFIVGLSSNAIVSPKEIDIPIIIYERATNKYYRYAIELDGNVWHKKGDEEKNELIKESNWKLIRIWFKSAEKSKENIESGFRKMADDVCAIISADIKEESKEWKIKVIDGF